MPTSLTDTIPCEQRDCTIQHPGIVQPLTRLEVSKILKVSIRTLENWQKTGEMPKSVTIGGRAFWHSAIFYDWLDRKLRAPVDDSASTDDLRNRSSAQAKTSRPPKHLSSTDRAMQRNQERLKRMAAGNV
ncbi:Uncharacterised protein [Xylophilus ampelinus]|nr:Uncharacterised protein [Xylophilus ampelinus]